MYLGAEWNNYIFQTRVVLVFVLYCSYLNQKKRWNKFVWLYWFWDIKFTCRRYSNEECEFIRAVRTFKSTTRVKTKRLLTGRCGVKRCKGSFASTTRVETKRHSTKGCEIIRSEASFETRSPRSEKHTREARLKDACPTCVNTAARMYVFAFGRTCICAHQHTHLHHVACVTPHQPGKALKEKLKNHVQNTRKNNFSTVMCLAKSVTRVDKSIYCS